MNSENLKLNKIRICSLPMIDQIISKLGLQSILSKQMENKKLAVAIEVLIKNFLLEPAAMYRIPNWSKQFDPKSMGTISLNDDLIGRALDRLFDIDRATLQTKITTQAIQNFEIELSRIHNDSTSIKFSGTYRKQNSKAVKLKRGFSKDHRPDLKQILYNLSISEDGGVPIHFKAYDGNVTDDKTHIETWLSLRSLIGRSDFLYVADSKLCTAENLNRIDKEKGRFITIVPRSRSEVKGFYKLCYESLVHWDLLTKRQSPRKKDSYDVFQIAKEFCQLDEGYRIYWYRSSEKKRRDSESRKERLAAALEKLSGVQNEKRRGPKTEKTLLAAASKIISRFKVDQWIIVETKVRQVEEFIKTTKGAPSSDATYRRVVKEIPYLVISKDHESIERSKAIDGIFPLTTNTKLSVKDVLEAYKYQPNIEKQFAFLKSDMQLSPVFLKNTHRIEALVFVAYLACLVAALLQRKIRIEMNKVGLSTVNTLPEERATATPTWEQIQRLFSQHCKYELRNGKELVRVFSEDLSEIQKEVVNLLGLNLSDF